MNKKALTEADIRTKFITPSLDKDKQGSWDLMMINVSESSIIRDRLIHTSIAMMVGKSQSLAKIYTCRCRHV